MSEGPKVVGRDEDGRFYECGACGARSRAPSDVEHRCCGICGVAEWEVEQARARAVVLSRQLEELEARGEHRAKLVA